MLGEIVGGTDGFDDGCMEDLLLVHDCADGWLLGCESPDGTIDGTVLLLEVTYVGALEGG